MKTYLVISLLLLITSQAAAFGLVSSMMSNPSTVLSAARYMTQILMRNMAQKRTGSVPCIEHVSRSAVTFFNEAAAAMQLGRLLQLTMRRATVTAVDSAAVPLDRFCQMVRVRRLRAASATFVSRLTCLGDGAVDDTDRLFRSLVHTIEHVCRDGGRDATQFMDDARQCRRLDAEHEEKMEWVKSLHRDRRDLSSISGDNVTAASTTEQPNLTTTTTTALPFYASLQACFDDVSELLPAGGRLSQGQELTDVLLALPALLPRLLRRDGLAQFCPALLKAGDCAYLALSDCPPRTQKTMARFFQRTLRGILCDNIPDDKVLSQLIWSAEVKQTYFGL